jgi:hypothetical protein
MVGGAVGGDGSPRLRNRVHGLEEKEGVAAFLPCSEATAEKTEGGDGEMVEFGGDDELGRFRRTGAQLRKATRTGSWSKGSSMSDDATHKREKRGIRRTLHWWRASPAVAENRGGSAG